MTLDPPAAAARRRYVLDRIAEHLIAWGSPLERAEHRAREVLDAVTAAGYALPAALDGAPPRGPGSTEEGRVRARVIAMHTRHGCRCDPLPIRALPAVAHYADCPVRVADEAAHRRRNARPDWGLEPPRPRPPVSEDPPPDRDRPTGNERADQ